jgi:hypothetical protein
MFAVRCWKPHVGKTESLTVPFCGCEKYYVIEGGKRYKCANNECYKKYSATVGTIFENSKISLSVRYTALHVITVHKKEFHLVN